MAFDKERVAYLDVASSALILAVSLERLGKNDSVYELDINNLRDILSEIKSSNEGNEITTSHHGLFSCPDAFNMAIYASEKNFKSTEVKNNLKDVISELEVLTHDIAPNGSIDPDIKAKFLKLSGFFKYVHNYAEDTALRGGFGFNLINSIKPRLTNISSKA